jgi:glyoxylase-like metal-dependent hydrolase (beta-lactamase superfamily II)
MTHPGWFVAEDVGPGITRLHEPLVHRWFRGNVFVVRGRDRHLVVDGGTGVVPLRPALGPLLDRPAIFVATHGHVDHIGAAGEFAQRLIHAAEAGALLGDEAMSLRDAFRAHPEALAASPGPGFDLARFAPPPCPATGFLEEGDVLDLGDRRFTVLHLPGHSPGCIGLLDEAGVLLAGDAVYEGVLVDDLPHSDRAAYRTTMRRLAALPVSRVHGGHNAAFGPERLRDIALAYLGAAP